MRKKFCIASIRDYAVEKPGIMKAFVLVLCAVYLSASAESSCYNDVIQACMSTTKKYIPGPDGLNCTSKFGGIDVLQSDLQKFSNHHFIRSFEYLMLSTHFANYELNRPGFEKLFRGLSDEKWEEAIELIKYITKRGGSMKFGLLSEDIANEEGRNFDLNEFAATAKALDYEKKFEMEAQGIQADASVRSKQYRDAEVSSYIENEYLHEERDIIRKLAGYTTDLHGILSGPDSSLGLFIFDEYLQNQK